MFSAYWHKFFLLHWVAFDYLKYHKQTAFKVLSLIFFSKFCCNFLLSPLPSPQLLFSSSQILLNSAVGCCFPNLWFSDFKSLQTLGMFSVWRWTLAKLISSGDMKAWLVILAHSTKSIEKSEDQMDLCIRLASWKRWCTFSCYQHKLPIKNMS